MKVLRTPLLAILISIILVGCWDMVETNKRLFVGAIGVDTSKDPGKYEVSFIMPIVRKIAGGSESGGEGPRILLVSAIADSVFDASKKMVLRQNRVMFFEHMRVFIIGEDLARSGIEEIIIPFWRRTGYNRRGIFVIAEGSAKEMLEGIPNVEKLQSYYIEGLFQNNHFSGNFFKRELGDFMHHVKASTSKGDALVSKIALGKQKKEEVNIGGAAVIKDFRLSGWLSEEEIQGVNFCLGRMRGGNLLLEDPQSLGEASFEISSSKKKISLVETGENPGFVISITTEGNIVSTTKDKRVYPEDIERLSKTASEKIKMQAQLGIEKLQKDYRVDLIDISDYLYKYHPKLWKIYEPQWEDIFPDIKVDVKVETRIKGVGVAK